MGRRSTVARRRVDRASTFSKKHTLVLEDVVKHSTEISEEVKNAVLRILSDKERRDEILQQLNLVLDEGSEYENWERYSVCLRAVCIRSGKPNFAEELLGGGIPFSLNDVEGRKELPSAVKELATQMEYRLAAIIEMVILLEMKLGMKITGVLEYSQLGIDLKSVSALSANSFSCQFKSPLQRLIGLGYYLLWFRTNKGRFNEAKKKKLISQERLDQGIAYRIEDDDHSALLSSFQTADKNVTDLIKKVHASGLWKEENCDTISALIQFLAGMQRKGDDKILSDKLLNAKSEDVEGVLELIFQHQRDKIPQCLDDALDRTPLFEITSEIAREIIQRINEMIQSKQFGGALTWSPKKENTLTIDRDTVPHETPSKYKKLYKKDLLAEPFE
jgi:hypothetical protein